MIVFLLFSKSINKSSRALERRLIYLCTILFIVAAIVVPMQLDLFFSRIISQFLFLLFLLFAVYSFDAVRMMRKNLDDTEIAFHDWVREKQSGRQRFVLKKFGIALSVGFIFFIIQLVAGAGASITVIITSLILIGTWYAIAMSIWHLNNKYQDEIHRLLNQSREVG